MGRGSGRATHFLGLKCIRLNSSISLGLPDIQFTFLFGVFLSLSLFFGKQILLAFLGTNYCFFCSTISGVDPRIKIGEHYILKYDAFT